MIEQLLLAERALGDGLLDQAESLYRRAVERDPQNGIAVVGLARVALERGDAEAAHRLACQALEIDPENAAAGGLRDRLASPKAGASSSAPDAVPEEAPGPTHRPGLVGRLLRRRR